MKRDIGFWDISGNYIKDIQEVDERELKMSLEHPNWSADQKLYDYLFYQGKGGEPLTEQEKEFCKTMYHFEEYAHGLDGLE